MVLFDSILNPIEMEFPRLLKKNALCIVGNSFGGGIFCLHLNSWFLMEQIIKGGADRFLFLDIFK